MSDCLFCRLISEQKLQIVYEDEQVLAFPDHEPKAETHLLIVPKTHIESVNEANQSTEVVLGHLFTIANQLAKEKGVSDAGYRLVVNTGADAGQTVFHLHMHLLGGQELGAMNS